MKQQEIIEELTKLYQLDVDAIAAYDAAISGIGAGTISSELSVFKLEHQRHALELAQLFLGMGTTPPAVKPDVKGGVIGAITAIRSRFGPEQALQAMRGNEQLTNTVYAKALAKPFPEEIREVVRRGHGDEQRHLAWIERAIDSRLWESAGATAP
jgi:hypothetical protein